MKKKLKTLTPEEKTLWQNFSQNVEVANSEKENYQEKKLIPVTTVKLDRNSNNINKIEKTKIVSNVTKATTLLIDKKLHQRLKSGRINPEKTLDLHGLTHDTAKIRVINFIIKAYNDNLRLLLVITGKGKTTNRRKFIFDHDQSGVLKRSFPTWLESDGLKPLILNFTEAHFSHGGDGAYYLYLRRNKTL